MKILSKMLVLINMLCPSASSSPSVLCFEWLELGLCQTHFFVASWLLVRSPERRGGEGKDLPSYTFFAVLNYSNPRRLQLASGFSSYWHRQNKAPGPSELSASIRKCTSQLLSHHHLGFYIQILFTCSFPQPWGW